MSLKQYTSQPTVVHAIQYDGVDIGIVLASVKDAGRVLVSPQGKTEVLSNHGWVVVNAGDWILQQDDGELYPCSAEYFAYKYTDSLMAPDHLPDHMKRVFVEVKELDQKLALLGKYLGEGGQHSSPEELELQHTQFHHMGNYSKTLHQRLAMYAEPVGEATKIGS